MNTVCLGCFSLKCPLTSRRTAHLTHNRQFVFHLLSIITKHSTQICVLTSIPHYIPVVRSAENVTELRKEAEFIPDISDGQQNSIMIHSRFPRAALIFSVFVPVTPSLSSLCSENK